MNGTLCGYYDMGNGYVPVVCLEQTGDLVVMDDICGPTYISELTVENPIPVKKGPEMMDKENCVGMVISEDGIYRFDGSNYKFHDIMDISKVKFEHSYDTEQSYEGDDIEYT